MARLRDYHYYILMYYHLKTGHWKVRYSDESGIQVLGIQMVTVFKICRFLACYEELLLFYMCKKFNWICFRVKFVMNTDTAITHPIVRDLLLNVYSQVTLLRQQKFK